MSDGAFRSPLGSSDDPTCVRIRQIWEGVIDDDLYDTIHNAVKDALASQSKKNQVMEAIYLLFCVWVGIAILDYLSRARWMNEIRYSVWYSVDSSQVKQTEDKPPSDCDFLRAPIGRKGCHYDKTVIFENIITRNDTSTNRPVVSYDGGQTWSWNDGDHPASPGKVVYLHWQKVEE